MASLIHVYVVDSQPVFCTGIQIVLETTTDLQLLGTATSLEQRYSWAANKPPDVLLLAANTSHDSLLETISTWRQEYEDSKVLVMLSHADEVCLRQLTDHGADGCILKTDTPQRFIHAIRSVAEGENWFSRTVMQETLQTQILSTQEVSSMQLTEEDKVILRLPQHCMSLGGQFAAIWKKST